MGQMNDRRSKALLGGLTLAALLPFLNKAYDIDDPLFLWMAEQIIKHPFDPYGATVHWSPLAQPMWVAMQNPPLCSYYIAAIGSFAGFGEMAMHIAFLLPALAAILGTFAFAKRLCASPVTAALLTLFTPVFLISASHVMCDVMLLAFWMWAIHFWIAGLEREKWRLFLVSALLVSAATLTKYFGISLVPLLLAYTLLKERRFRLHLVYLTLPLLVIMAFELIAKAKYGHAFFTGAMLYLRDVAVEVRIPLQVKLLTGCSFVGGCMVGSLFVASARSVKVVFGALGLLIVVGVLFWICVPMAAATGINGLAVHLQGCLFATVGIAMLALAVWDFRINQDADSLLLLLWTVGTFAFAAFLNWSITARTILPMVPAVSILFMRHWDRVGGSGPGSLTKLRWVGAAAVISLVVAAADYSEADASRAGARYFRERYARTHTHVWFQSHWGFQFYMQKWKAKPLVQNAPIHRDDMMIIPSNNADYLPVPKPADPVAEIICPIMPLVATFAPGTGAGFYSSVRGPVPWAIAQTAPARFEAFKFR
jgi:4-amino-4-deoxy-L-arabinose transferase-like glycosyltransferase